MKNLDPSPIENSGDLSQTDCAQPKSVHIIALDDRSFLKRSLATLLNLRRALVTGLMKLDKQIAEIRERLSQLNG